MITLTREEAQQVLDAFAWELDGEPLGTEIDKAVKTLRAALAQPEPEPVAYYFSRYNPFGQIVWDTGNSVHPDAIEWKPLYTAPPQRKEWQGLTDEEIEIAYIAGTGFILTKENNVQQHTNRQGNISFAKAIAYIMMEKNNG